MSKSVMISLLKQGQTGDKILSILDTLIEEQEYDNQPTLEEIKF